MKQARSNPIDPETELDQAERAAVVSILDTQGWEVFRKLMEIQIARFDLALKNADPADAKDVLAKHSISKAASQFYVQIIDRLNTERDILYNAPTLNEILPSVTDALIEE